MEQITVRNLTFSYGEHTEFSLKNLSFSVRQGEILLLMGESGCGKTTLIRHLNVDNLPQGIRNKECEILLDEKSLFSMEERERITKIGFVRQNVEASQATDKVWHELAFGLESLGYSQAVMQRKIAEMTAFFGLESIYYESLMNLSGGQKQLVNLASVMVMEPEVLILDEPTSQLDPISAGAFFQMIEKINKELGTTILITEHHLEEVFPLCDRVMVMEQGRLQYTGTPSQVAEQLYQTDSPLYRALPAPVRLYFELQGKEKLPAFPAEISGKELPLDVKCGSVWLAEFLKQHPVREDTNTVSAKDSLQRTEKERKKQKQDCEDALKAEEMWFRYEKQGKDILKECEIAPLKGKITAILGGNGAGKSTLLHVLAGHEKPYRGKIKQVTGRIGMLPQNPQAMFVKKTVLEEVRESFRESEGELLQQVIAFCKLEKLLTQHPYDLSGGEMQRLALAKLLLEDYDILLLDEPGKGMDYAFKEEMGDCLKRLAECGKTILMVSHDVEFCAKYSHQCGLFFDGHMVSLENTRDFFMQNVFYTTAVRRICGKRLPRAVTIPDVLEYFDTGKRQEKMQINSGFCGTAKEQKASDSEGKQQSADSTTDRKQEKEHQCAGVPSKYGKWLSFTVIFLIMPLTIYLGETVLQQRKYYFISLLLILEATAVFFYRFESRKPKVREVMIVAVLCAITVASRAAFYMLPAVKPVAALVILTGVALGSETGFLVGALSMLVSNLFFGQGPWTPWQMFATGMLGFTAGMLFKQSTEVSGKKKWGICIFGAVAVILLYGGIMNPASVIMYQEYVNLEMIFAAWAAGLPFDAMHAASTFAFLAVGTRPVLGQLERVKKKYGFFV